MTPLVFAAVLCAAALHASWNSLVKASGDKFATMLVVLASQVPIGLAVLAFVPAPTIESLPWLIASLVLHLGYQLSLVACYRIGDLTLVYPIARGSAPLIVAVVSATALGISFTGPETAAIMLIVFGIISLALVHRSSAARNPAAIGMALVTGCFIASYSLVDGIGARAAGTALGYWSWSAVGSGVIFTLWALAFNRASFAIVRTTPRLLWLGCAGGAASYLAYAIVVWGFTQAPIALVTALRETSIVFALLIGVGILKEPLNLIKVLSTMLTIGGVIVLRLSKT